MTSRTKKSGSSKTAKKAAESAPRKIPILGIAFAAIALLLILAIVFSSEESIGSAGEYGEPEISGEELPPMEQGAAIVANDAAFGLVAPQVTGQDFDDSTVAISHDGTPKAIVFLAHWCQHCQREVPAVQSWLDSTGGVPGVDVLSVTTSASSGQNNWPPSEWLDRESWTSPNIRDDSDSSVLRAYGGSSFPYWVFLNGDGTVAHRQSGRVEVPQLQAIMESLASG